MTDDRIRINGNALGKARYIEFFKKGRAVNNQRRPGEVFFSIEKRNTFSGFSPRKFGYIKETAEMKGIFDTLIQERIEHRSIDIIEWDDSYNVVFRDGIHISTRMCRLEKDEFLSWEKQIEGIGES